MTYAKPKFNVALTAECLLRAREVALKNLSAPLAPEQLIKMFENIARQYNNPYGKKMSDSEYIHCADMLYYMFVDSSLRMYDLHTDTLKLKDITLALWTMLVSSFPDFAACAQIIGEHPRKELADESLMEIYNKRNVDNPINLKTVLSITDTMRFLHCVLPLKYSAKVNNFLYPKQVSKIDTRPVTLTHDAGAYLKRTVNGIYGNEPQPKRLLAAWFPFRELWCFYDLKYRGRKYEYGMPRKYTFESKVC